ncbi:MAG: NRDE family protein, partial [Sphingorhabdus sp.]
VEALSGYNPCNLLLVEAERAALYANHPASDRTPLGPGLHSLSNGHAGEPWPRRRAAEEALGRWLNSGDAPESFFAVLRDESLLDDAGDSVFINAPVYGTRCSTVVAVAHDGSGWICERCFNECGIQTGEGAIEFNWR